MTVPFAPPAGSDEVLVVVDMQFTFAASQEVWMLKNVEREILQAKARQSPVIVVAIDWATPTYPVLTDHVANGAYKRYALAVKKGEDGSAEIIEACLEHGFATDRFRVCGVNIDACLMKTVEGLLVRRPKCAIYVPMYACNCAPGGAGWQVFPKAPNVVLMPTPDLDPLKP